MNIEETIFLSLLKDFLQDENVAVLPETVDWNGLHEIAKSQSLQGVCYRQLKQMKAAGKEVPLEVLDRFHKDFLSEIYYAANRQEEMKRLNELFLKESIAVLPFKGWDVKEKWNEPLLRTMGDIDLLIHEKDRLASDRLLMEEGYTKYIDNDAVWTYQGKDITLELHSHMFYEHLTGNVDYQAYFDKAWDYYGTPLWESFHFVYLIGHLAKHLINHGIGFRVFLDLSFLSRSFLDWEWIVCELKKIELYDFAARCFSLCSLWFSMEIPVSIECADLNLLKTMSEKLFRDGTFGLENKENQSAHAAKELLYTGKDYSYGSVKLTLHRLFPPYRDMRLVPWYSFVDGRPWLLPAAWIYRWWYCLRNKKKASWNMLVEPLQCKDAILKRQEYLYQWGLVKKNQGSQEDGCYEKE